MERRDLLRFAASLGAGSVVSTLLSKRAAAQTSVRYEVYGRGPALFLGSPISASNSRPGGDPLAAIRQGYLDRLTDRYQVIVMDYPPTGPAAVEAVASFDPAHVCADILAVADAAGGDRFAWYGYSWGGVVGLQLAARTDRLSALICGGWPPMGASYPDMAVVAQWLAERARRAEADLMVTFYRALEQWRDEEAVSRFTCPRMTFAASGDTITTAGQTIRIGPLIAERKADLERMGWMVHVVDDVRTTCSHARRLSCHWCGLFWIPSCCGRDRRRAHDVETNGGGPAAVDLTGEDVRALHQVCVRGKLLHASRGS